MSASCIDYRAYYGNVNFFGGPSSTSVKASSKLKQLEEENEEAMFVVVSDVWLDNVEVMDKLNLMFSGLTAAVTAAYVLDEGLITLFLFVSDRIRCHASHLLYPVWKLLLCSVWENTD